MKTTVCPQCGKEFSYYPSAPKQFCSNKCRSDYARVFTNCPECGKRFWYFRSWPRKYCSMKCRAVHTVSNLGKHSQGVGIVQATCNNCGKLFKKRGDQIRETNFCNQKCFGEYLSKTRKGVSRPDLRGEKPHLQKRVSKNCPHCGKQFFVKISHSERRVYCSKHCLNEAGRVYQTCQMCGKNFVAKKAEWQRKFCSRRCQSEHQKTLTGVLSNNWRGGSVPYGENWIHQRNAARIRDKYTCQDCGITEEEYGQELDVHHKIPRRKFNGDYLSANKLSNLITLCKRCHQRAEPRKG